MLYTDILLFADTDGPPSVTPLPAASPDVPMLMGVSHLVGAKVLGDGLKLIPKTAFKAPEIPDLLFGQVHFLPTTQFDLGVLFSDLSEDVFIWNTLSSAITLDEITEHDLDGVDASMSLGTIDPFEIHDGTIDFNSSGAPSVNGWFNFVTSARTIMVTVSFTRALILPFMMNDLDTVKASYKFSTIINTSRHQKEQRRSLFTKPQRNINYALLETHSNKMLLRNLLAFGQDKTFIVPIYMELIEITSKNDAVITTSTDIEDYWNLINYSRILFVYDFTNEAAYTYEISSINTSTKEITTAYPILEDLGSHTIAFPAFIGTLDSANLNHETDLIGISALSFTELIGENMPALVPTTAPTTYFDTNPDWQNMPKEKFDSIRNIVGYTGTAQLLYDLVDRSRVNPTYAYRLNQSEQAALLNNFCYQKGRYRSFYFRDWIPIVTATTDMLDSDTVILIEYVGLDLVWYDGMKVVIDVNHTLFERDVIAVSVEASGEQTVTINSSLGIPVAKQDLYMYFKKKVRFSKDILEFTYPALNWGDTSIEFFELIQEV